MIAVCFLGVISMLLLASCQNGNGQPAATVPMMTETEAAGPAVSETAPVQDGRNLYVIVRSDAANSEEKAAAIALRNALRDEYGVDIVLYTDWYNTDDENQRSRYEHEIIFGSTNREESRSAKQLIEESGDRYRFVLRGTGNDYVIFAEAGYYQKAVDAFLARYAADQTMLSTKAVFEEIEERGFALDHLTIYGRDISEYTAIVYPASYTNFEKGDAVELSEQIFDATGVRLPIKADNESFAVPVIRIGGCRDEEVLAAGGFSYMVAKTDEGILLSGTEYFSNWVAIDVLSSAIRDGMSTGSVDFRTEAKRISPVKDRLHVGAWVIFSTGMTSEEQVAEIKDCGFDLIVADVPASEEKITTLCKWMTKYEVQGLRMDGDHYADNYFEKDFKKYRSYTSAPVTWGQYLCDEPSVADYSRAEALYNSFLEKIKDKVAFINLFPAYATLGQLGADSYREYVEKCFETIHPPILSVDIYPLWKSGIYSGYFSNLSQFSSVCRENGADWTLFIQSNAFATSVRAPEEKDLRWQIWCGLSFGVSGIHYFTYRTSTSPEHSPALIDRDNKKTDLWYAAQKVNSELNAFSDVYRQYRNLGAYTVGAAASYAQFEDQYTAFDAIGEVTYTGDDGLLIGAFEKNGGTGKAFTCVNLANPGRAFSAKVTVTAEIKESGAVTLYRAGQPETLTVKNGQISFELALGEGVFVTIDGK